MAFCHGQGGDDQSDGCCYLPDGTVCHLRLKLVGGRVLQGPTLTDLGTVDQFVRSLTNNGAARNRATQQAQGITFACMAAIRVIAANASLLNDRPAFESAWLAQPDYASTVAPLWRAHEQKVGLPEGSQDCPRWKGPECCYSESTVRNEEKAASLSTVAVTVRRAGGS